MNKIQDIENWLNLAFLNFSETNGFLVALPEDVLQKFLTNKTLLLKYLYIKNIILLDSGQLDSIISEKELIRNAVIQKSEKKTYNYFSKFSKNLNDLNVHPRKFRLNNLKREYISSDSNKECTYYVNKYFPKLTCDEAVSLAGMDKNNILALSTFKYCRISRHSKKKDVLCSFCQNINWINWKSYKHHLLFSHGILISSIKYKPSIDSIKNLYPLPQAVYENTEGYFINTFVLCRKCGKWILLGKHSYDENEELLNQFGFFWRYFYHYVNGCCNLK